MKLLGKNKFSFTYLDKQELVEGKSEKDALEEILNKFDEQRTKFIEQSGIVTPTSLTSTDFPTPLSANGGFEFNDKEEIDAAFEKLLEDVKFANKTIKSESVGAVNFHSYFLLRVAVSVDWMSHWNACAINIDKHRRIVVEVCLFKKLKKQD
jgi:hypothetical protein